MKMRMVCSATLATLVVLGTAVAATPPDTTAPARMVITVQPPQTKLAPGDVVVSEGNLTRHVEGLQKLPVDLSDVELFLYMDDSTRSSSLGTHLAELRSFIQSLPASTKIAIGYMRNGTFALNQSFTTDHQKASAALRLPESLPGGNGSPYFALSDLVKHWPSKEPARRAVLMLTDGVDRYYDMTQVDDPYVNAAIHDALKSGVQVSSIYLSGAGFYGRGPWSRTFAQSRLQQVADQTGGSAYFEALTDPVDIAPFLQSFHQRLQDQYLLTFAAANQPGQQEIKLRTELPGVKVQGPTRIYVK